MKTPRGRGARLVWIRLGGGSASRGVNRHPGFSLLQYARMKGGARKEIYDVVVIGSGSAGMSAAFSARETGASVCVVERDQLGGECPNWACVPSKALLRAAKAYREAKEAGKFGVSMRRAGYDFADVMRYSRDVVERVTGGGEYGGRYVKMFKKSGIETARGSAVFVNAHTLYVGGRKLEAKTFVIATGTKDLIPPIEGLEGTPFWGSRDVMRIIRQPRSLAVIGGGPVGCELSTFFGSFDTRVTLIQGAPSVLNREDAEISALAKKALERIGIEVLINSNVSKVVYARNRFCLTIEGQDEPLETDQLLVSAGRRPATDALGIEKLKLKLDSHGYISVDETQVSSLAHVFAAGDVTGGMQFTHVAHPAGDIAGYNAAMKAFGKNARRKADFSVVPRVTFISLEVASVGLTEEEAKAMYRTLLVGTFNIASLGRAVTESSGGGLVKLVADAKTKKLVGGHIMAERAGEMIHEVALGVKLGARLGDLANLIHAFPTYSEAIAAAAANAKTK
ncbi:TPA: hypothetical protein DDZ10_02725 [Candidatus Uhrbacteria bacterium]|nr:hypothetical protein [Candidatus Uhrbacteria bacterium]